MILGYMVHHVTRGLLQPPRWPSRSPQKRISNLIKVLSMAFQIPIVQPRLVARMCRSAQNGVDWRGFQLKLAHMAQANTVYPRDLHVINMARPDISMLYLTRLNAMRAPRDSPLCIVV